MLNLSLILEDSARRFPNKEAITFGESRYTFKALNELSNQVANALITNGLIKGDKVALSCPNLPYFPIVYFGILKAGGVVVPLSILLKKDEISYHLKDSNSKYYFCFEGSDALPMGQFGFDGFQKADGCQELIILTSDVKSASPFPNTRSFGQFIQSQPNDFTSVATSAEDTAVIIYTSGTTGRPKGAELTHSNLAWNADLCRHLFQLKSDDSTLTVLPMFHIFGQTCLMNASIMHGITNAILPRFDPNTVLRLMQKESVSFFAGVPTMYWALLNVTENDPTIDLEKVTDRLRLCISGGASLPIQVLKDFEEKYKVPIYEGYGMSEGSPVVTFNHPGKVRKPGSVGTAVWGIEVKIVDDNGQSLPAGEKGQLLYKGHNVMKGYYNRPEVNKASLKGGWMHSGDVAIMDDEGYFFIVDRTKDMIIRGGLNVYPREVEEVIMQHEEVSLVAIIGVPDDKMGEEIKGYVVKKPSSGLTESALIEWTKNRIAAYKYPRFIEFVDQLPMNATGKILKRELRNR